MSSAMCKHGYLSLGGEDYCPCCAMEDADRIRKDIGEGTDLHQDASTGDWPSHHACELVKQFGVEAGLYWRSSELMPDRVERAERALLEFIARLESRAAAVPHPTAPDHD